MSKDETLELLAIERIDFLADKEAGKPGYNVSIASHLSSEMKRAVSRRLTYLLEIEKFGPKPNKADVRKVIAAVHERLKDENFPALLTIYRWLQIWRYGFHDIRSLVPLTYKRGSRTHHQRYRFLPSRNLGTEEIAHMQLPIEQIDRPTLKSLLRGRVTRKLSTREYISQELPPLAEHVEEQTRADADLVSVFLGKWRETPPDGGTDAKKPSKRRGLRSHPVVTAPISTMGGNNPIEMARRTVNPNSLVTTGLFPSIKMKNNIPWEGINELCALYLLEIDPEIVEFWPQPKWMTLLVDDEYHDHCPDLLTVTKSNGPWYLEVKSDDSASEPEFIARSEVAKRFLARQGFGYHVFEAQHLRAEPRLYNAKLLYHHLDEHLSDTVVNAILDALHGKPRTIHEVASKLGMDPNYCFCAMLYLHGQKCIKLDWHDRIHFDTVAHLPRTGQD